METALVSPASTSASAIQGRARGVSTPTANGVLTAFTIAHGLGSVPSYFGVTPGNPLSAVLFSATADATNLTVSYVSAPLTGSLSLRWVAEV